MMTEVQNYQFKFCLEEDSHIGKFIEFLSGRNNQFLCDPRHWEKIFLWKLTPRLVDLLRIAAAVYFTDRISHRDCKHINYGWSRSLGIQIEVFDHNFWSSHEVMDSLHGCLDFLSGDLWDIGFISATSKFLEYLPFSSDLKPITKKPIICLYSGGLDSAAGLVHCLGKYDSCDIKPLLVRHSGQGKPVMEQIKKINRKMDARLSPYILPFWMRNPRKLGYSEEYTQRTRSFLFCAAAGVAGAMIDAHSIYMMEGGIGAINVPLMAGMVGSKATRNSHPTFLRKFSDLLQLVTNKDLVVELPHQYLTKAELTKSLVKVGLEEVALSTASCVHYPLRDSNAKQCGTCPACIFRRQALLTAGIAESGSCYQYDLFSNVSSEIPKDKLDNLLAFLMQIDKLSQMDNSDQLPAFVIRHLRATEVISSDCVPMELVDLYKRYRLEWLRLIDIGQQKGWKWTQMMEPVLASS